VDKTVDKNISLQRAAESGMKRAPPTQNVILTCGQKPIGSKRLS